MFKFLKKNYFEDLRYVYCTLNTPCVEFFSGHKYLTTGALLSLFHKLRSNSYFIPIFFVIPCNCFAYYANQIVPKKFSKQIKALF